MVPTLIERLRRPITRVNAEVALLCEAAQEGANEIERLRRKVRELESDSKEDARSSATEASWKERQGEDYGTF